VAEAGAASGMDVSDGWVSAGRTVEGVTWAQPVSSNPAQINIKVTESMWRFIGGCPFVIYVVLSCRNYDRIYGCFRPIEAGLY
jgi:hypothetical protein